MTAPAPPGPATRPAPAGPPPARRSRVAGAFALAAALLVAITAVHLTQGTSSVGALDLLRLLTGGDDETARVLVASRLPRLLTGLAVGVALGFAGAALQSTTRNPLASPDTLAVNAGAHLAIVSTAAFGIALPALPAGGLAFCGGLAAASLVMLLSAGGQAATTRLILAGSATAMALSSLTMLLMLLFEQATIGLFAWGNGSLVQGDLVAFTQLAPVIAVAALVLVALGHRLDLLALGDDTATVLGLNVRRTRLTVVLLAVLLSAAAVTLAGPIGFVGLGAPVIVRLLGKWVPEVHRHRVLMPLSGIVGVVIVLGSDVLLRAVLGGQAGVDVPTGVVTTLFGAVLLVWLARRHRDAGPTRQAPGGHAAVRSRGFVAAVVAVCAVVVTAALVLGMLAGDTWVLLGDIVNWVQGRTGPAYTFVLDARWPRVAAALLAGAALALAGTTVQAVCRNPLAEPGILGITGGAGIGAVSLLTFAPMAGVLALSGAAGLGAVVAFALVYGLARRRGLNSDRLVLIGFAVWQGGTAIITFIVVSSDPWNTGKALTWLSGSTYGRTAPQVLPVAIALLVALPVVAAVRRELDLLALDDDTPRVLGVRLERARLVALGLAALLTATAVSAVGVIGFVGLVAPHAARALVGGRHTRVLPVAVLLGATLVSLADTLGRSVIAPAQVPAGLVTAMIGTPYFVWLLWRSRAAAAAR
ncbi:MULTISPECIES: iron ABC transporter permease [Micromonospora]|uniref:iron ABC transporter permease n=1 Tax=Micromonospora TaxID=1873 RepID=UPI00083D02C6|nr:MULTISPECIES: iron ABC transporter permease [Micromonospora]MBQ1059432.1 iron ABC transporter permease [Micromonospora sp. C41]MCK1805427.1 iron ABC transporter permease [Micromonospora sp. R42106]MCK1832713.1 iron ABC transporter permease [Micromonospora sp. R42003]MCK1843554.1 iron ABC transporter permease [Micromonospora sp. R42004]MCM1014843.1 iron ABC transporter permease [Micromonospora sp. XM-20-01]